MEWICGNGIAKIGGKKKVLVCGNAIAEIGEFFFFFLWQLWQCHCQKWEEKKKKRIVVAEIWGGIKKKKRCYVHKIFTIFSQQITGD